MKKTNSIKFNFLMNSILTLSSIIFPLITFPYVSRVLTPIGTGKVSLATSVVSYFSLIAQLGIPTYGIRVCAKLRDNERELISNIQELLIINLIMSSIVYNGYIIMLFSVDRFTEEKPLYFIMSITILLNAVGVEWLYKGLEQYAYITARSVIFKLLALVALFLFVHQKNDYIIYGGISVLAASASNVLNFINARKYIFAKSYRPLRFRPHLKAVFIFFAMSCATTIYTHLDTVMIGFMNTDADVGYYNSAIKIKQFLISIITSLGAVLLPRSSYFLETKQFAKFKEVSAKALRFIFIVGVPMMVFFLIFADQSVYFLSGYEYKNAILPMRILMPTILFIGLSNLLGIQMLVPMGKEKHILYSELLGAAVDFVINLELIPRYASVGAAIGTLVAELVVLLYQFIILRNIVSDMLKKISYWKIIMATVAGAVCSLIVLKFPLSNFWTLFISSIVFFCSYSLIITMLKEDLAIELINGIITKVRRQK